MKKYYVYWIHYQTHSDPTTEGYIGVSSNPKKRFLYHSSPRFNNNSLLFRSIEKGLAHQTILYEYATDRDAYAKELELRPKPKIGWNLIPGGDSKPPVHYGNTFAKGNHAKRHSEDHKKSMSERFSKSRWYNDGIKNIRCEEGKQPEGFHLGRICGFKWNKNV